MGSMKVLVVYLSTSASYLGKETPTEKMPSSNGLWINLWPIFLIAY